MVGSQNKYVYNVIVLLLSHVSNEQMERQLPEILNYFEKLNLEKYSLDSKHTYEVFQYHRYNIMGPESLHNQIPLFSGLSFEQFHQQRDSEVENFEWIWDTYYNAGYSTAFLEEHCLIDRSVRKFWSSNASPNIEHSFLDIFCEQPTLGNPFQSGLFWKHGLSCISQDSIHNLTLDYLTQLIIQKKALPQPLFATALFMEGAEYTQTRLTTMDLDLVNFLQLIQSQLPRTFVFLLSDHGQYLTPFYNNSKNGQIEHKIPGLFLVAPYSLLKQFPALRYHLTENQFRLINALDIYQTLRFIATKLPSIETSQSNSLPSLFDPIPKGRSCSDIQIDSEWCLCESQIALLLTFLFLPLPILLIGWWVVTWNFHLLLFSLMRKYFSCFGPRRKKKTQIVSTMKI